MYLTRCKNWLVGFQVYIQISKYEHKARVSIVGGRAGAAEQRARGVAAEAESPAAAVAHKHTGHRIQQSFPIADGDDKRGELVPGESTRRTEPAKHIGGFADGCGLRGGGRSRSSEYGYREKRRWTEFESTDEPGAGYRATLQSWKRHRRSERHGCSLQSAERWLEAAVLLRPANRAGDSLGSGQTAHTVRHLFVHNEELSVLQNGRQGLAELDKTQSIVKSLLHKGTEESRGARQGIILEDRSSVRGETDRAGVQTEEAARCTVLPCTLRSLLEVCGREPFYRKACTIVPCRSW